jgi:hypothetical protein
MQNGLFYTIVKNEPQGRFWDRLKIEIQLEKYSIHI